MRIVFLGASRFGLRCLRALGGLPGCEVAGVVTAPQTFAISYRPQGVSNVLHADVTGYCESEQLPCRQIGPAGMKDEALFEAVRSWRPQAFVVAGWYHLVPRDWRELAPAYGLHGSLLPRYRGGAPLVWAIINGESRTGITLFQFDDGVDTGPIVAQAQTPIAEDDTIASVYERIEALGERLLVDSMPRLADGALAPRPQPTDGGSSFPQRGPEDGLIDWSWTAGRIHDFIRAQTRPYPGAFFHHAGGTVTVWAARPAPDAPAPAPGELRLAGERVLAGAGDGRALQLLAVQVQGVDMEALAWARAW